MDKRYRLPIVIYLLGVCVSLVLMFVIYPRLSSPNTDLVPLLIPGFRLVAFWDMIIVYFIMPFFILVIGILFDKLVARILIWLQKVISFKRNDYMIIESVAGLKKTGMGLASRTLIPAFFSLSIGFALVAMLPDTLFYNPFNLSARIDYSLSDLEVVFKFQAIFFASALALPITYFLFSPLWLLEDAGVTYFYKLNKERKAINIQGVSRYFTDALKGYITFTVLFSFATYIYLAIQEAITTSSQGAFMILFSTIAVPLLLITFLIPGIIYHEKTVSKQVPKFLKKVRASGIPDYSRRELENYLPE